MTINIQESIESTIKVPSSSFSSTSLLYHLSRVRRGSFFGPHTETQIQSEGLPMSCGQQFTGAPRMTKNGQRILKHSNTHPVHSMEKLFTGKKFHGKFGNRIRDLLIIRQDGKFPTKPTTDVKLGKSGHWVGTRTGAGVTQQPMSMEQ